ncbi:MAG: hypothetical protein GF417_06685 [Candidatus Latescibacteria bacterium]|nr:hypothetical protein [bacterium]MBD3424104.1 hypothetical protein [Candidatus Latescibacterota bacterium]
MKCSQAREYYFSNRDGLLNESERMELQKHMEGCEDCARFREEMDQSLSLLEELPPAEVSESFVWNVKRKISQKKVDLIRSEYQFREGQNWISRFVAGAAAAFVILALGAWFYLGTGTEPGSITVAESDNTAGEELSRARTDYRKMEFTSTGYPAGLRMVNDDFYENGGNPSFDMKEQYQLNYLVQENKLLRQQVMAYRNENLKLRRMLLKYVNNK